MSLGPQVGYLIPEETVRVAQAAFPHPSLYMRMRDALGPLYSDQAFTQLFPARGQPAIAPARLALILVMQMVENLSDREAADAVRGRIDWKYALALELTAPGFDASVLSEFRARLIAADPDQMLLKPMLTLLRDQGLLKAAGRVRTDSTHVLAAVRILNRLTCVGETLRHAREWRSIGCRRVRLSGRRWQQPSARMASNCSRPSTRPLHLPSCGVRQRSKSYAKCGCNSILLPTMRGWCAGALKRICHPVRC
jgi:transposase